MYHRGYSAHAEFDERDGIFVGRVLGTNGIVSFHAETAVALRIAFEAAVDAYVAELDVLPNHSAR